ncbi:MAG: ATP-binding protein [Bacteriovorax sp.]|nr:ATP-binding protein [Bacteriovorax sp.]
MISKRLLRQVKKTFGEEEYYTILPEFINENLSKFSDAHQEKLGPLSNFEDFINVIEQSYNDDQILLSRAQRNLETSSEELAQINKDLFKTNKIIEHMLNSLDQGFVIFDKELRCLSLYTKATIEMFTQEVEGRLIQDVLPFEKVEKKESFVDWCELVYMDMHEFETLKMLAPKRLVDKKTGKTLDLDFKTVRDADNVLLFIILIVTDRTQEIINQNNTNKMQEYAQMVSKVISDKKTTYDYVHQIQRLLIELREILSKEEVTDDGIVIIKRLLHTTKGAGNTYFFGDLGRRINEIELKLNGMEDKKDMWQLVKSEEVNLVSLFEGYLKQVGELTNEENKAINLSEKSKDWLIKLIKDGRNQSFSKDQILDELHDQFILSPVHDYISLYNMTVIDLAKRLGKPIPRFEVTGENVRINYESHSDFLSELVHIFTNIMDHGLEFEGDRITRKKPVEGLIKTHTEKIIVDNGVESLKLVISDDGDGINPEKIRNKLLQMEKYKDGIDKFSDEALINFIFGHGFSTAVKKTDISGQGVGLDALKAAVERLEGTIKVESKLHEGTTFTIVFPLKEKRIINY